MWAKSATRSRLLPIQTCRLWLNSHPFIQLFRQRLSHKSVKAYATMPIGIMGRESLVLINRGSRCLPTRKEDTFVCDVSLYVAETPKASIKDHELYYP